MAEVVVEVVIVVVVEVVLEGIWVSSCADLSIASPDAALAHVALAAGHEAGHLHLGVGRAHLHHHLGRQEWRHSFLDTLKSSTSCYFYKSSSDFYKSSSYF